MALADIANVAEIIGVILVVVTLIFLTLQIQQNTRALKATTTQNVMNGETAMMSVLVEHADVWDKIQSGAPLTPGAETRRAIVLFNLYMIETESRYHQYNIGYLDAEPWNGRLRTLPGVVCLPTFKTWRQSLGSQSHTAEFLQLLDGLVASSKEP
jgi:hypothetical protein